MWHRERGATYAASAGGLILVGSVLIGEQLDVQYAIRCTLRQQAVVNFDVRFATNADRHTLWWGQTSRGTTLCRKADAKPHNECERKPRQSSVPLSPPHA